MGRFREDEGRFREDDPEERTAKNRRLNEKRVPVYLQNTDRLLPRPASPRNPAIVIALSKPRIFFTWIIVAIIILGLDLGCAYLRVNSCSPISDRNIKVNGSTDLVPLVQDVVNSYQKKCFGVNISVSGGKSPQSSLDGVEQVEKGAIDVGASDVFANPYQNPGLQDYQVAIVVFVLVVNDSVDVTNLDTVQIRGIYSGDIANWRYAGSNKNQDIVLISRPTSDTRLAFEKYVLGQIETRSGPQSLVNDTSDAVARSVKKQIGAIGYVPLYYARKYSLKILSIDGNDPQKPALVEKDAYKFWDIEHMYTKGVPESPVKDFIEHMYSPDAKQIIKQDNYLDPGNFAYSVLLSHVSQA